jgi:lipopolysaccharide heptosyltransferase I
MIRRNRGKCNPFLEQGMDAEPNAAPRILISRLSAVGDCILTLPLANAVRAHFPRAFIGWVVQGGPATLLEGHPAVDQLIVVKKGWLGSPAEFAAVRRTLRSLQFDITLDPQSLSKSAIAAWLSGAPRRIGLARPIGRELAPLLNNQVLTPRTTHVVERQLELLRPLGIATGPARFDIPVRPEARRFVQRYLDDFHLKNGYAVINPGAGWDSRLWPPDRYGRVARFLGETHRLPSVVAWSGAREQEWAETIVTRSGGHALLGPATTLPQLAALMASTRIFVGSDTGPLHLAAAMGAPCVSLHGTTEPKISGPYGQGHQVVQAFYQEGSSRERRKADNRAMRAITVEMVCEACVRVLRPRQEKAA